MPTYLLSYDLVFYHFKVCKTLLCILLLDFCLGNVKPSPNHKPYTLLHCFFYTESPTESKSSEERGRYRSLCFRRLPGLVGDGLGDLPERGVES